MAVNFRRFSLNPQIAQPHIPDVPLHDASEGHGIGHGAGQDSQKFLVLRIYVLVLQIVLL